MSYKTADVSGSLSATFTCRSMLVFDTRYLLQPVKQNHNITVPISDRPASSMGAGAALSLSPAGMIPVRDISLMMAGMLPS